MLSLRDRYTKRHGNILTPLAAGLETLIRNYFSGVAHVDRVAARAKGIDQFLEKATRKQKSGAPKYTDPLNQIQDQVGARVVVFYLTDVPEAAAVVERYFHPIEHQNIVPESEREFGYFGQHYVLIVPTEVYDGVRLRQGVGPQFFELQVRTLFQHAWSEAEHDLGYKPRERLSGNQRRKIAFTAAQAWGADLIFDELHRNVDSRPRLESGGSPSDVSGTDRRRCVPTMVAGTSPPAGPPPPKESS